MPFDVYQIINAMQTKLKKASWKTKNTIWLCRALKLNNTNKIGIHATDPSIVVHAKITVLTLDPDHSIKPPSLQRDITVSHQKRDSEMSNSNIKSETDNRMWF